MNKKQAAGDKAAEWIQDGMTIGLGTGSTVYYTTLKVGERVQQGLRIQAIPTSTATETLARKLGIPLTTFADVQELDLTIDGADAVSPSFDLIKGGGGALLREKLVAEASKKFIVVVDDSKQVTSFNDVPIPIEIVPFAWETTIQRVVSCGGDATLRLRDGQAFLTDNHNFIVDSIFPATLNPRELHSRLKSITGVVETGLFIQMADIVVAGAEDGTKVYYGHETSL